MNILVFFKFYIKQQYETAEKVKTMIQAQFLMCLDGIFWTTDFKNHYSTLKLECSKLTKKLILHF